MKNLKNNAATMKNNSLILMASKTDTAPSRAKITEAAKGGMRSSDEDDYKITNYYKNINRA